MNKEYKGKPIITAKPPFWRHHMFPWGWYSVLDLDISDGEEVTTSGFFEPGDGEGVTYRVYSSKCNLDGGGFIDLNDS